MGKALHTPSLPPSSRTLESEPQTATGPVTSETGTSGTSKVHWKQLVKEYRRSDHKRSLMQLVSTWLLFIAVWWAMIQSLAFPYWTTLALAAVAGGLTIRLFGFFHDCVHDSFFRSPAANRWVGRFIGLVSFTPFAYWRRTHRMHHATSGNLDRRGVGDIDTITVDEYLSRSPKQRFVYRLSRNPLVLLFIGPIFLFVVKHRVPYDMPRSWKKEWASVVWYNVVTMLIIIAASSAIGFQNFIAIQLPVFFVATTVGIWLFYVQHQFHETYWARNEDWNYEDACFEGSSYLDLPQPLRWFTADIGVHHIHHLCSAIPNYLLHECMVAAADQLPSRRMTLRQSVRCSFLALWDEKQGRLISFRELDRTQRASV